MKYSWNEYVKAKEIVRSFEEEKTLISTERYRRRIVFCGYTETKEQHFQMLKVRIWLKREYLSGERRTLKKKYGKSKDWETWLKGYLIPLEVELYNLRREYFLYKKHGITRPSESFDR